MAILYQLRRAAKSEITKFTASNTIIESDIIREAEKAFDALSTLLGQDKWFFERDGPTLFDASVFAYVHLILTDGMRWKENYLGERVKGFGNLVKHQERILELYY